MLNYLLKIQATADTRFSFLIYCYFFKSKLLFMNFQDRKLL